MSTRRDFLMQAAVAAAAAASQDALEAATDELTRPKEVSRSGSDTPRSKSKDGVVRLAIVGTGEIAPRYLKQAVTSERARFVATCARTIESAKARAVEYGIDAWFNDYRRMYDTVKPDAVVIATPDALHAEQSIAALERGIHVLCEKPMAMRLEDCQAMVAAAERSGTVLLALPYDATPPFLAAMSYLNEAALGVFTGAEAHIFLPGGSRDNAYDSKVSSGAMLSTLVYPISRLVSLLGPARRVSGVVNTLIPHRLMGNGKTLDLVPPPRDSTRRVESTIEDNATLVVEWPSGQQAVVRCLWGTSIVSINNAAIYGRRGALWFTGTWGNDIVIHSPERAIAGADPVAWGSYQGCYRLPVTTRKDEGLIEHFIDCIEGRSQPTCGGPQALHVHEILFRGGDAARSGQTQDLKTTFTPWHKIDPAFHDTRSRFV